MTDVSRLLSLTAGINAALNSIGTAPGAFTAIQPRSTVPSLLPRSREAIDRPLPSQDGRRFPRLQGRRNIDAINLPLELKGINNNTGGAVADWEAKQEAGMLWPSLFGAVAAATLNAAPTATSAAGVVLTASTNVLANLDIIGVATDKGLEWRQVVSGGGTTTPSMNAALLGTVVPGSTIIRAARYTHAPSTTNHKHVWFNAEWENLRRRYSDCAPGGFEIVIPTTGIVEFNSTWLPNDWSDQAEADPAFSAPTAGQPVVSGGCSFIIAAKALMMLNAKLTVDNGTVMRESSTGVNGVVGGVCADKTRVMLEVEVYVGNDSPTIGELVDDSGTPSLDNILGSDAAIGDAITTRDVMLCVGVTAGASIFMRLPEADIRGEVVEGGPFNRAKLTCMATGSTPLYFGVA